MFRSSRGLAQISSQLRLRAEHAHGLRHDRTWISPGVGDPPGEHRHVAGGATTQRGRDFLDLAHRHQGRDVQPERPRPPDDERPRRQSRRACWSRESSRRRSPPTRDRARLLFHLAEVVGEDLERDGQVGNELEDLARERLVVFDAGLRIRVGFVVKPETTGLVASSAIALRSAPSAKIFTCRRSTTSSLRHRFGGRRGPESTPPPPRDS